ncbi:polysaccharide pyruvyl transferase family protein [Halomonas sp. BC04]|uniref:polysaccharide pyruvyl transferase family protein n=1 Tax=Halomonas sp. BC04 TaxID=1403540 RepID=UPI0022AEB2A1|nr:polysaccharide pyruvyl transferase family protein [Halomonas sp. BC04]
MKSKHPIQICSDLAFLLKYDSHKKSSYKNSQVDVVIHLNNSSDREFFSVVNAIKDFRSESHITIESFSFISDSNKSVVKGEGGCRLSAIKDLGIKYSVIEYSGVDGLLNIISGSNIIFTDKLHVGISGIALGKKVVSLAKHQKIPRLYKQLKIENTCVYKEEVNSKNVQSALRSSWSKTPSDELIYSSLHEFSLSLENFLT